MTQQSTSQQAIASRPGTLLAPQLDYILFDGSSSMRKQWWKCCGALDQFVATLRERNINSHAILSVFDSNNLGSIQRDCRLADWPTFDQKPLLSTFGMTPLFDAINKMGWELRDLAPQAASIVIVTDGEEKGSQFTSLEQAKAVLDWCRAQGWQVTFIGADFENKGQARALGARPECAIGVRQQKLLEAGKALGAKRANHAITGADINFSDDEKENFGGYLGHSGSIA